MLEGFVGVLEAILVLSRATLLISGCLVIITIWLFAIAHNGFDSAFHVRQLLNLVCIWSLGVENLTVVLLAIRLLLLQLQLDEFVHFLIISLLGSLLCLFLFDIFNSLTLFFLLLFRSFSLLFSCLV